MVEINNENDLIFMKKALELANKGYHENEVPVGAVIVCNGKVIGSGYNKKEILKNAIAHAEILAINEASINLNQWRLHECTMYLTLEPCFMCLGALINSRISRLVFGAFNVKMGFFTSLSDEYKDLKFNNFCKVDSGLMAIESRDLLRKFFKHIR